MPGIDLTNRKSLEELAKLPIPTNNALKELFFGIDRVTFKDGGVYEDKAMTDKLLLTISQPEKIAIFETLLEIDEQKSGFHCMCLGTYAIELYSGNSIKATIGFHHGVSIRYNQWRSDVILAKSEALLRFLAEQGFSQPLSDHEESLRRNQAQYIAERKWFDNAPRCFNKYREEMSGFDKDYFPSLITDLKNEISDSKKQVIKLLQTYGNSNNLWTAYPIYENIPYDLLVMFSTEEIIEVYLASDRNYKTRIGLGRFLCGFDFRKKWRKQLKYIPQEVIDDLRKCFNWLKDEQGISLIAKMQSIKDNQKM